MKTPLLSTNQLQQVRILQIAFTLGPLLFFATSMFMYLSGEGLTNLTGEKNVLLIVLTAAHFAILALLFPVSVVLPIRFLNRFKKVRGQEGSGKIVVSAHLVRLVLMEIPAFFGLVVVFLAIVQGSMYEEPLFWVNTASFFILLAQNLLQFPNNDVIERYYGSTFE